VTVTPARAPTFPNERRYQLSRRGADLDPRRIAFAAQSDDGFERNTPHAAWIGQTVTVIRIAFEANKVVKRTALRATPAAKRIDRYTDDDIAAARRALRVARQTAPHLHDAMRDPALRTTSELSSLSDELRKAERAVLGIQRRVMSGSRPEAEGAAVSPFVPTAEMLHFLGGIELVLDHAVSRALYPDRWPDTLARADATSRRLALDGRQRGELIEARLNHLGGAFDALVGKWGRGDTYVIKGERVAEHIGGANGISYLLA
jgi:hypothetical protein